MAYCDRCGSYIPDGWTSCPACGYDAEKEAKQNSQAAAAQAYPDKQEKFSREEAEKRRAQRQAYDKVWAENEQRRRREEEEFARRQQEQEERRYQQEAFQNRIKNAGESFKSFVNSDAVNMAEETVTKVGGKILPLISYLGPLCFLSLIIGNDDFTKFHAKQGLRLFIWGAILQAVGGIFAVGWAVAIFQILMAVIGIKNVLNGEEKKLPYIGG